APFDPPLVRAADGPAPPSPRKAGGAMLPVALALAGLLAAFCCGGGGLAAFLFSRARDQPTDSGLAQTASPTTRQSPTTSLSVDEAKPPPAYWAGLLKSDDANQADRARERLVRFGALAVPALRPLLHDPSPAV